MQFLNFYGCEFCIRLALFAEFIGICHFSWLLYYVSSYFACGNVIKLQKNLDDGSLTSEDFDVEGGEQMDNMNKTGGAPATANSTSDVKSTDAMLGNIILLR